MGAFVWSLASSSLFWSSPFCQISFTYKFLPRAVSGEGLILFESIGEVAVVRAPRSESPWPTLTQRKRTAKWGGIQVREAREATLAFTKSQIWIHWSQGMRLWQIRPRVMGKGYLVTVMTRYTPRRHSQMHTVANSYLTKTVQETATHTHMFASFRRLFFFWRETKHAVIL